MPARNPEEIRREIERTREEIAHSIVALRENVTQATDWRTWARRNPVAFLGGAFALGLVVGLK